MFIISPILTEDPIWRQTLLVKSQFWRTLPGCRCCNQQKLHRGRTVERGPRCALDQWFVQNVCILCLYNHTYTVYNSNIYIYIYYYMYCVCRNLELHQLSQLSHQSYMWFTICGGSHRSWPPRTWSSSAHVWQDVENYKICGKICTVEILWVLARIRMVSWPRITMR